jgi:TonB family protein
MKTLREYIDQLDEINRRDFLKGAGATAGLAALGTAGVAKAGDIEKEKLPHEYSAQDAKLKVYGDLVRNAVVRNIVFNPASVGNYNPAVIVGVSLAPDGTIVNYTVLQGSAFPEWDRAVLRAIEKTKVFPKDAWGQVPRQIKITFRPKESVPPQAQAPTQQQLASVRQAMNMEEEALDEASDDAIKRIEQLVQYK